MCNLKFSHSHIKKERGRKETGEINFDNIFYETQYTKSTIISTGNQHKSIIDVIFYILLFLLTLQNWVCILHLQHTSVWTGYISSIIGHMWLLYWAAQLQGLLDLECRLWDSEMDCTYTAARGREGKWRRELHNWWAGARCRCWVLKETVGSLFHWIPTELSSNPGSATS